MSVSTVECGDIGGANVAMDIEVGTFEVRAAFSASFLQTNWIFFNYMQRTLQLFLSYHNVSKNTDNSNNIIVTLFVSIVTVVLVVYI